MTKLILISALLFCCIIFNAHSQDPTYDLKYTVEYSLKDINGNVKGGVKLYRDNDKMKFTATENRGTDLEKTTDIYIFKNEGKIYTVITGRGYKTGSRHAIDISFVGMQTGVYIIDLGDPIPLFPSSAVSGNGTVLGKDCVRYLITSFGDSKSEYFMYQNNLMLKRFVGSSTEGNTLEATSYDNTTDIPPGTFVLPTGVDFPDF
jgi:hypothetical protein